MPTGVDGKQLVISSLEFTAEGLQVSFMVLPDDFRDDMKLVSSHMLAISTRQDEVGDDVVLLREAAERLVRNAIIEWDDAEIVEPGDDDRGDDDDDDRGMGE